MSAKASAHLFASLNTWIIRISHAPFIKLLIFFMSAPPITLPLVPFIKLLAFFMRALEGGK
jgi:hypothetical protein